MTAPSGDRSRSYIHPKTRHSCELRAAAVLEISEEVLLRNTYNVKNAEFNAVKSSGITRRNKTEAESDLLKVTEETQNFTGNMRRGKKILRIQKIKYSLL